MTWFISASVRTLTAARRLIGRAFSARVWSGPVSDWRSACHRCSGYDDVDILHRVAAATRAVKDGRSAYERDSVLFDRVQHNWPLLASLLRVAAQRGQLRVLDFGGSLGSTYRQCRAFLPPGLAVRWTVVEQPHFVQAGRTEFTTDELSFASSMDEASECCVPDVILFSSVLQYIERSEQIVREAMALAPPFIIVDRTPMADTATSLLTIQRVPANIYKASYPCWVFSEKAFRDLFAEHYQLLAEFPDFLGTTFRVGPVVASCRGQLYARLADACPRCGPVDV